MDFNNPLVIVRMILPKVPLLLTTAVWHSLYLSPTSSKWDIKTELVCRLFRAFMETKNPRSLAVQQRATLKDPGIKGKMWISKATMPAPEMSDVLDTLCKVVDDLKETEAEIYATPPVLPVEGEWTGYRANVDDSRPRLDLTEGQHYQRLMAETKSDVTILYMHGGALIMMDPASHRLPTSKLARLTQGRCFSVRYRLAPQNPFPAALLDVFIAYLSLLFPPPGAYHSPVLAGHVVFSGDSAGGTLSFALLQLLLQINRTASETGSIRFHNHTIHLPLPLPAGVATNSAWLDLTNCLPSVIDNYATDYLPRPTEPGKYSHFPKDEIWPADPPRGDLYCDTSIMTHPLASPVAATSWKGSCPMFVGVGEEMLADDNKVVAAKAAIQGVPVVWQQWEAMPHCASLIFMGTEMSRKWLDNWTRFISQAVQGSQLETKGSWLENKTYKEKDVDVASLSPVTDEELRRRMKDAQKKREIGLEGETKLMPKL